MRIYRHSTWVTAAWLWSRHVDHVMKIDDVAHELRNTSAAAVARNTAIGCHIMSDEQGLHLRADTVCFVGLTCGKGVARRILWHILWYSLLTFSFVVFLSFAINFVVYMLYVMLSSYLSFVHGRNKYINGTTQVFSINFPFLVIPFPNYYYVVQIAIIFRLLYHAMDTHFCSLFC